MEDKKLIFSAIQPTGTFTLGNYIGAVTGVRSRKNTTAFTVLPICTLSQ